MTPDNEHVDRYAREMAEGAFMFAADARGQVGEGGLLDGQHRLRVLGGDGLTADPVPGLQNPLICLSRDTTVKFWREAYGVDVDLTDSGLRFGSMRVLFDDSLPLGQARLEEDRGQAGA